MNCTAVQRENGWRCSRCGEPLPGPSWKRNCGRSHYRRDLRRELVASIRSQFQLATATVTLSTAAARVRQCGRCPNLGHACAKIHGSCAERRMIWLKAICTGAAAAWCPMSREMEAP